MSSPTATTIAWTQDDDALDEAHTWEELAEYERGEVILHLLRRISSTCLRSDRLRVLEREEWVCSGTAAENVLNCSQNLLLFGHVRCRHRDALLMLIRQMRLHAVSDLGTSVTIGLQPGDAVPHIMLEPLSPSLQTGGCIHWNRVYYAMRCGILQKLYAREEKVRQRLRELIQETDASPAKLSYAATAVRPSLSHVESGNGAKQAETLRFYTEEFGQLFTTGGGTQAEAGEVCNTQDAADKTVKQFLPLSAYMAATKETRVSLTRVTAIVPTVLVAWSAHYPECVEWLQQHLFNDTHLRETRNATGLSGRFAVLMDKDPWASFAEAHGGLLPRPPTERKGFKIDLLRPLPKRGQIVLLNMDEDAAAAQATLQKLRRRLDGWVSPEVDLLSLWSGPEGLQSDLATLFNVQTLPFVVQTRPAHLSPPTIVTPSIKAPPAPVIVDISCDPVQVSKGLYDVPDTPRRSGGVAETKTWHNVTPAERARLARRCGTYFIRRRLPLYFTCAVSRDYVLRDAAAEDPWKAVCGTPSSHVCVLGDVVTTDDLLPLLPELKELAELEDFEWGVRLMRRSAPLVSSLDVATPRRLLKGETRCITCSNCATRLYVDTDVHVRCLHCISAENNTSNSSSSDNRNGALCETCAFTRRCHTPHHVLLRVPAGQWRPSLSLLWGPSNVVSLDLFLDRFVSNASDYHYGIYCDRCRSMIRGTRWKCAVCYQYDLCDACARVRRAALPPLAKADRTTTVVPSQLHGTTNTEDSDAVPPQHDDVTHPMLFIPFAQGSQADKFLQPQCFSSLKEWLTTMPK
jgi:hypothetical protein